MIKNENVSTIMTKNVLFVDVENTSLYEVQDLMANKHIRHLPVLKNKKLVGIISLSDILRLSYNDSLGDDELDADNAIFEMLTVAQVMHQHPKTATATDTIEDVAKILAKEEFHSLPILEKEKLVGIVTTTDLINYLIEKM